MRWQEGDWQVNSARPQAAIPYPRSGRNCRFHPRLMGRRLERPKRRSADQLFRKVEAIVDGAVGGEEAERPPELSAGGRRVIFPRFSGHPC